MQVRKLSREVVEGGRGGGGRDRRVLALLSMIYPALLAAVAVMMLLPNPKLLMLGYLLGAYLSSIGLGLLVAFSLHGSATADTARKTIDPLADVLLGILALTVGLAVKSERVSTLLKDRRGRHPKNSDSWPRRVLGRGSARLTFVVGVVLSIPGAFYLLALDQIARSDLDPALVVLLVVAFCVIQLLLLELPLLGFQVAPTWTQATVVTARDWLGRNGARLTADLAVGIGVLLVLSGLVTLLVSREGVSYLAMGGLTFSGASLEGSVRRPNLRPLVESAGRCAQIALVCSSSRPWASAASSGA
jgi:hypothetical protein